MMLPLVSCIGTEDVDFAGPRDAGSAGATPWREERVCHGFSSEGRLGIEWSFSCMSLAPRRQSRLYTIYLGRAHLCCSSPSLILSTFLPLAPLHSLTNAFQSPSSPFPRPTVTAMGQSLGLEPWRQSVCLLILALSHLEAGAAWARALREVVSSPDT